MGDRTAGAGAVAGSTSGSGSKDPLEAAAEAAFNCHHARFWNEIGSWEQTTWIFTQQAAIAAYLDQLLGGLPEEAVEAAAKAPLPDGGYSTALTLDARLTAFLRSLRGGLNTGGGV